MGITYKYLLTAWRKGLRNGNWKRLSHLERALYRASLCYAKYRSIRNTSLVEKLCSLIKKLKETPSSRIFRKGFEKAVEIFKKENVLFAAALLREWLKDPDFIFWLGTF